MAQSKELRLQTGLQTAPTAGVVKIFADISGTLNAMGANSTIYPVGQQWTGVTPLSSLAGVPTITGILTGAAVFLPIIGPSGALFAIPAYRRV